MPMFPTCFAHAHGRETLTLLQDAPNPAFPSESQAQQMANVCDMEELPPLVQRNILMNVIAKDEIMGFMSARCRYIMPDATFEPRALMYARLLASTQLEAMVICAMLFAIHLDAEGKELTYNYLLEVTKGRVLDHDQFAKRIREQNIALVVEGLDHDKLNHKDSYIVEVKV